MNTTTPEKCPKCGADFLRDTDGPIQFHCGSVSKRGYIGLKIETAICTGRQRDQLAERVRVFEAALSDPAAVWANMLRGTIAMPPHIPELEGRLTDAHVRIQELEEQLSFAHAALESAEKREADLSWLG